MKKILAVLMVMALAFGSVALAEEEPVAQPAPDPDLYSGAWECDRALAEFVWEEKGYRVRINWGSSAWECTTWEYSCYYDEETGTMLSVPFGTRTELVYDDNGEVVSTTTVYDDGVAAFSLDEDGNLIWADQKENAGEGMKFVRVPEVLRDSSTEDAEG